MAITMRHAPLPTIEPAHLAPLPGGAVAEWEAIGEGDEALVWVEGGPGLPAHLARADVAPVLDRFRCYLVNAPGSGRSTHPRLEETYGLEATVAFFDDWRRSVGLGPVTLMGHSWGGLVAPAWAALHPDGVQRLIVISGYAGGGSVAEADWHAERDCALDRIRNQPWFDLAWRNWEAGSLPGRTEQDLADRFWTYLPFYFSDPDNAVSMAHIDRVGREQRWHVPANDAWCGWRDAIDGGRSSRRCGARRSSSPGSTTGSAVRSGTGARGGDPGSPVRRDPGGRPSAGSTSHPQLFAPRSTSGLPGSNLSRPPTSRRDVGTSLQPNGMTVATMAGVLRLTVRPGGAPGFRRTGQP